MADSRCEKGNGGMDKRRRGLEDRGSGRMGNERRGRVWGNGERRREKDTWVYDQNRELGTSETKSIDGRGMFPINFYMTDHFLLPVFSFFPFAWKLFVYS